MIKALVYVAGPLRGKDQATVDKNMSNAKAAAFKLWRNGIPCICPHANTHLNEGIMPPDGYENSVDWIKGDLEILKRCDAILLLPGWTQSEGAQIEAKCALEKRIPAFFDIDTCIESLTKEYEDERCCDSETDRDCSASSCKCCAKMDGR